MTVYIPTYGRVGHKMRVVEQLGRRATLVVRSTEQHAFGGLQKATGCGILVLPQGIEDIGATRHWIVKRAAAHLDYVWMMDDDLLTKDILIGMNAVMQEMKRTKSSLGCFGPAFMANARFEKDGAFSYNKFGNAAWCVRRKHYIEDDVDMSVFRTSEDMYCWLKMMTSGRRTVISNKYLARKREGQGGGCDEYRTTQMILDDMVLLQRMFKPYYQLKESRFKSQGRPLGVVARVSWVKLAKNCIG